VGGVLGGVVYMNSDLDEQIERVFVLAKERQLNLDFHVDENGNPESVGLREVARAVIKYQFSGRVICGHCCSLAVQPPGLVMETIELVKEAGIGVVNLPATNIYLQDRSFQRTPRWRGVTLLHELKRAGVPVAIASDNCRDPFCSFGDRDLLEVFKLAVKIAHLDLPFSDWPQAVTKISAELMGLADVGKIGVGLPADLILFKGRNFSELLSRPESDRVVLRNGKAMDTTLPDYRELDDLINS
ncbi:MAG: amidohydrolase family protein, partial [Okeania sp. SIO2H7]|nr:amidohydrolase family protein [Okeania sp. SIO2H7]